ncbi:hypothetical protein BHE74_00047348, partial [Ensete ventricosum]
RHRTTLPTDPFLSAITKNESYRSRCFFHLDSDLDRWLPHRKSINDGTPCSSLPPLYWSLASAITRLLSQPLRGAPKSLAIRFSLISFSNWRSVLDRWCIQSLLIV